MGRLTPVGRGAVGLAVLAIGGSAVLAAQALAGPANDEVADILAERLPKTEVSAVDCEAVPGICEVQAGGNLFYTDRGGRYLIVGRVYDMETRQDLTAARLLAINPDMLVGAAAKGGARAGGSPETVEGSAAQAPDRIAPEALAALPDNGAIRWGDGARTLTVFSDLKCGYCQQLHQTLARMDIAVVERPISILGTRALSNAVLCADNPARALASAYRGEPVAGAVTGNARCDTSGLDANEAFARKHGLSGTPVIVRADGAVVRGLRDEAFLSAWLDGEAS